MKVQIFLSIFLEYGQVVRHPFLVWKIKGSNPFTLKQSGPITQLVRVYA